MPSCYEGVAGRPQRVLALLEQEVVCRSTPAAERLADLVSIEEVFPGTVLIKQDDRTNHMYFILSGEVSVLINDREINRRIHRQTVGEMALVDIGAPRSATCVATSPCVLARIEQPEFIGLANEYPEIWRAMTRMLADRLRQRNTRERFRNQRPIIFLGSSSESNRCLERLQADLNTSAMEVRPWTSDEIFKPSISAIEALEAAAFACDFAALVFGPDDKVLSRWSWRKAPRDNVIFELGLFMGAMGRDRTFMVEPVRPRLKTPSDLQGVTTLRFRDPTGLGKIAEELNRIVQQKGPL
jgi:CRP/FNR family transcriptional regulator, cyclic AMP receptor protein